MTDPHPFPPTNQDSGARPDRQATAPRRLSAALVGLVLLAVLVMVVLHITGALGPGMH